MRLATFRENWRLISEHNAADRPYKLGVNGESPLWLSPEGPRSKEIQRKELALPRLVASNQCSERRKPQIEPT